MSVKIFSACEHLVVRKLEQKCRFHGCGNYSNKKPNDQVFCIYYLTFGLVICTSITILYLSQVNDSTINLNDVSATMYIKICVLLLFYNISVCVPALVRTV